jgi:hypothetical protein
MSNIRRTTFLLRPKVGFEEAEYATLVRGSEADCHEALPHNVYLLVKDYKSEEVTE